MWQKEFYSVMLTHRCATFWRLSVYFSLYVLLLKMTYINIKLRLLCK